MERKSNITIWQLRLFEGLNKDIMVMQRNEEEVFDDAIHVFFEKEYYDAYVNIAGGIKINEPAIDLGIVMAIVSSYKNRPFDERTSVFGEVGLSGEVRAVNMPEQRVAEAKKLGFETCIVPEVSLDSVKSIGGIKIIGVKSINEAIGLIE